MRTFLFGSLFLVLFSSCNTKKTMQLAEVPNAEITGISDISQAYLFYNEETLQPEFNRKNLISTTHWIFHVDKRLLMEEVVPKIQWLQQKRKKPSPHRNEAAKNFFSVSNTSLKNLSFIDFTDTKHIFEASLCAEKTNDSIDNRSFVFNKDNILIEGRPTSKDSLIIVIEEYKNTNNKPFTIHLNFDQSLTFQEYITAIQFIKNTIAEGYSIAPVHYFFDSSQLPCRND
ncbi:hypothetical protein [Leptobacterium sp. I13]|uniref:hypothetical protein n=1 Tax=Leptobacterium meishanense TaxID=3128904 RepID=UPI0030EECFB4